MSVIWLYLETYSAAVFVGIIWGLSTPLLRRASQGLSLVTSDDQGFIRNSWNELKFLLRFQYILPFFMNQSASILFIYVLSGRDVSIIVPLVNALNFVFVFIGDVFIGSCSFSKRSMFGLLMVVSGLILCISNEGSNFFWSRFKGMPLTFLKAGYDQLLYKHYAVREKSREIVRNHVRHPSKSPTKENANK